MTQPTTFTPLRKLLKGKIELNPFNDKFQKDTYLEFIFSSLKLEDVQADNLNDTLKILPFLNDNFKEYYQYLGDNILNANLRYTELIDLLFTALNRNFLIATKQMLAKGKGKKEINQKESFSYKIDTLDKSIGKVEVASALESDIDALNYVLNFVRYFDGKQINVDKGKEAVHPIEIAKRIALSSNYFNILKNIYDESIWNMGFWKIDETNTKPKLNVIFEDTELLILAKVGLLRLQRNISSNFFFAANEIEKQSYQGTFIFEALKSKLKEKRIKSVGISDGTIQYRLAKGFGKKEIYTELKNSTAYITYYNFLENIQFDSLHNLSLSDLLKLFSLLQDLIDKVAVLEFDDSMYSINDLNKFPIKIQKDTFVNYFIDRSNFSKNQVLIFIGLISFKFGERINLWDRPLVFYNNAYYINYLPTTSPIILNLMDYWIEQGGFDLDIRGKYLEKYLQTEFESILTKKGFYNSILKRSKLFNKQKKFEELDLVIILKSVVLIAEVKCIKFPYDARDKHNSLNRLKQGVKQIKRKKEFIEKYKSEFAEIGSKIENRVIIPIVITNFPMFSGYIIDGIPIADYYLFESYFRSGKMSDGKIYRGGETEIVKEIFYYKNEDEMNRNIDSFFHNPYPIEEIKKIFEIADQKISLEMFDYDLYVTSAQIPEDYLSNFDNK